MTKEKVTLKGIFQVIVNSGKGFIDDEVMSMCGALSYATIFSLAPFVAVLLSIVTFFFGDQAVEGKIYGQLNEFMGSDAAAEIQKLVKNASLSGKSTLAAVVGGATLLFGATTVFAQIQNSLNKIWGIKPKPKKGWLKMIVNRLLSFSLILSLGFLLIVSFGLNAVVNIFSDMVSKNFTGIQEYFFIIANNIVTFAVLSLLFGFMFKILPDAKIKLKDVMIGAMVTAVLFMLGKVLISTYVGFSNFENSFGSAATIIVILVWIYYSAVILFFGAQFTKCWAVKFGHNIYPDKYAVTTKLIEVEVNDKPVEDLNKETIKKEPAQ